MTTRPGRYVIDHGDGPVAAVVVTRALRSGVYWRHVGAPRREPSQWMPDEVARRVLRRPTVGEVVQMFGNEDMR